MRDLLKQLAAEGRTVLVSSHLLSEMQILADDLVIIAAGRLVTQGPVDHIINSMGTTGQVRVRTPDPEKLVNALTSPGVIRNDDGSLLLTGVDGPTVGAAALRAGVELHELTPERPDLERVFLELTVGKAEIR
jgi:ABC-2 type transport system ATP-binding protein